MHIGYVDESGDPGPRSAGGSRTYALGCVLIPGAGWSAIFDGMIGVRRDLRAKFGLPVRLEVKANWLVRGSGPLRPVQLNEAERRGIYRIHMRAADWLDLKVMSVVVQKGQHSTATSDQVRDRAWETLLQRLERYSTKGGGPILVVHDHGDDANIRKVARKWRRAGSAGSMLGTGRLQRPFTDLLDDPVPRDSAQSYFIQMADLAAYAAFRRLVPPPGRTASVVPQKTWDKLGGARLSAANKFSGGPPGIVTSTA